MTEELARGITLHPGDCLDVLAALPADHFDACVTDPPYGLEFMSVGWDTFSDRPKGKPRTRNEWKDFGSREHPRNASEQAGILQKKNAAFGQFSTLWAREVFRVLKPGAHLVAFGGTRTYHRMACAIEDAGFEVRDTVMWVYGSGFPKSHNVAKSIDKAARGVPHGSADPTSPNHGKFKGGCSDDNRRGQGFGAGPGQFMREAGETVAHELVEAARQWDGWGTALKPAVEPIVFARKPLSERTVAANVLRWGTGAINVDGCRIGVDENDDIHAKNPHTVNKGSNDIYGTFRKDGSCLPYNPNLGRWPANLVHDGSEEVLAAFPAEAGGNDKRSMPPGMRPGGFGNVGHDKGDSKPNGLLYGDSGSAARFFYTVKQDEPCHSIKSASDADEPFALQSEHVVSALIHAVEVSTPRLVLHKQSYRGHVTNVSAQQLRLIVASVTEAIQNIERRFLLGLPQEKTTVQLGHAMCVATRNQTGTMTITIDLLMSDRFVEVVTFDIIETSEEAGAQGFAKRLFYTAKADADDRLGSKHPTIKPVDLMQWLVRLVTPPGGVVLDPFAGTGTTGEAVWREGLRAVLIEREDEHCADIRRRMSLVLAGRDERRRAIVKAKNLPRDAGPLFGGAWWPPAALPQ